MGLGPFGRPTLGGVDEHTRKRVPDVEDRTEAAVAATHPTVSLPTSPPLLVPIGLANHMIIDYHNDEFSGLSPWLNRIACFGRGGWDRLQSEGCKGDCGEVLQCSSPQARISASRARERKLCHKKNSMSSYGSWYSGMVNRSFLWKIVKPMKLGLGIRGWAGFYQRTYAKWIVSQHRLHN
ncbi:uncharacterized protein LOC124649140 isoform X1 [Lolium rigidum]|uniref:uncharacterized protein LOC124649140 isoform X1 n=1 Tax=Lolium rigidum TaxID=89674 RepID=UPI001F5E00AE|nr:uncharacterized protein LOC124649140 isoform X1 [Lolium rigidum]